MSNESGALHLFLLPRRMRCKIGTDPGDKCSTAAGTSAKDGRDNYDISFVAVHISHTGKQLDPYDLQ